MVGSRPGAERAGRPRRRAGRRLRCRARPGELWRVEGYVHPDAHGRGIGKLLATELERDTAARGARRVQNGVYETDAAARSLLESIGYRSVRVFVRCASCRHTAAGAGVAGSAAGGAFDPDRDALLFHAAQEEAFVDHWEHIPRDLEWWSKSHLIERAVRSGAVVRRQSRERDRSGNDLYRGHLRRRLRPDPLHPSAVA